MNTTRLEAFSDAVFAIILTIMVLEFKVPHGAEFEDLLPLWPIFISYVLSFVYVGIYWNNHHHLFHMAKSVNGAVLWANLAMLFWLSLLPFVWGDYWVIDLDADYQLVAVSEPRREYLWILSRSQTVDPARYAALLDRLRGMGFSLERLQLTRHGSAS